MPTASAVTGAGLSTTQATYYSSEAILSLYAELHALTLTTPKTLERKKGKTVQYFTYNLGPFTAGVAAGSTPGTSTEGSPAAGLIPTTTSVNATIAQYSDSVVVSDLALDVAIDPMLENLSRVLGYRAAMIYDTLVLLEADAAVTLDGAANVIIPDGSYTTTGVVKSAVASLAGRNIRRFEDGMFHGLCSPFVMGDVFNDVSNNGLVDVIKRNVSGQELLKEGVGGDKNHNVVEFAGVRFNLSTNVPLVSGVPTVGKSAYGMYITGQDGLFSVKLGATDQPNDTNFRARVKVFTDTTAYDPAGLIGGAVAYNFRAVIAPRPGSGAGTQGIKRVQSESAIS